jgi:hypothetical protein
MRPEVRGRRYPALGLQAKLLSLAQKPARCLRIGRCECCCLQVEGKPYRRTKFLVQLKGSREKRKGVLAPTLVQSYTRQQSPPICDLKAVGCGLELRQSYLDERFCIGAICSVARSLARRRVRCRRRARGPFAAMATCPACRNPSTRHGRARQRRRGAPRAATDYFSWGKAARELGYSPGPVWPALRRAVDDALGAVG